MSDIIRLGYGEQEINLYLKTLVYSRMMIQANSGGGKSTLMRLIAERAAGKIPFIILDWEGEFITLRNKIDLVIVGRDGEIPTEIKSAKLLARKLRETGISACIDLGDLEPSQRREYVAEFLNTLINLPRKLWHPTLIFIDEAHQLCPEVGRETSSQAIINLMSLGGKRGLCGILATQRISKLHKDAVHEAQNIFIGATWLDVDQKRAGAALGMDRKSTLALRDLAQGEFFTFGRAVMPAGVTRFQADRPQTKSPESGTGKPFILRKASDAIASIIAEIAVIPEEVAQEENELATARARISELERELTFTNQTQTIDQATITCIEDNLRNLVGERFQAQHTYLQQLFSRLGEMKQAAQTNLEQMISICDLELAMPSLDLNFNEVEPKQVAPAYASETPIQVRVEKIPVPARMPPPPRYHLGSGPGEKLGKGERGILTILAQYPEGRSRVQIALITGYSHKGGSFGNYLSTLTVKGYITGYKTNYKITPAGIKALGQVKPLPTGPDLLTLWKAKLGKAERLILDTLSRVYPQGMSREQVARATSYEATGGSFGNALSKLNTLELIHGQKVVGPDVGKTTIYKVAEKLVK